MLFDGICASIVLYTFFSQDACDMLVQLVDAAFRCLASSAWIPPLLFLTASAHVLKMVGMGALRP